MIKAYKGKVFVPSVDADGTLTGALVMTPEDARQFAQEILDAAADAAAQRQEEQ